MSIFDGTTVATKTSITNMNTASRKRASSWGSNLAVTGDGAVVATAVFDGSMGTAIVAIGCRNTGIGQWFGTLRNVRIWQSQLPNGELQVITT
jgi:hypothetical protein